MTKTISDWKAQVLRLTMFSPQPFDIQGLWLRVVGSEPEVDETRPKEFVRRQADAFGEGLLTLQTSPGRLDWFYTPPQQNLLSGEMPKIWIDSIDKAMHQFEGVILPWLAAETNPTINRIAFGLIGLCPAANRSEAYAMLQDLLPSVALNPEISSEFTYQINRPVFSQIIPDFRLNRVTKWNSILSKFGTFNISGGVPGQIVERNFAVLDCDISTPVDRSDALDAKVFLPIYEEFRDLAFGNLERGELP